MGIAVFINASGHVCRRCRYHLLMRGHTSKKAEARSAYDVALGLLARREQSRRELLQRLERRGYAREDIDSALDRLAGENYQSDLRFSEMLARTRIAQGYGPARLRAELGSHNVPDEVIHAAIEQQDVDWTELAFAQLMRRYHDDRACDPPERARRSQYLQRRGFDASTVRSALGKHDRSMDADHESGDNEGS